MAFTGKSGPDCDNELESLNVDWGTIRNLVGEDLNVNCGYVGATETGHDNGANDGLTFSGSDDEASKSESVNDDSEGDDSESDDDEDDFSPIGELVVVDGGDNGSEHEEDDSGNELGSVNSNGLPKEVRVQEKLDGSEGKEFFMLGGTYANKKELVYAIDNYAIFMGVKLKLVKSAPYRVKATCQEGCPFELYASKDGPNPGLVVKALQLEHNCSRTFKNPRAKVKWLAAYFRRKIQERPQYKVADMKKDMEEELKLNVSIYKCKRAKRLIMKEMEGSYVDEFNNLEAFCNELRNSNPCSDVSVEISKEALENGKRVFSRMYLCFHASKVIKLLLKL